MALVTNVEWEHVDVYEDVQAVAQAFASFASRTRPGGALVLCGDDAGARALLDAAPSGVRLVTYGAHTSHPTSCSSLGVGRQQCVGGGHTPLPTADRVGRVKDPTTTAQ